MFGIGMPEMILILAVALIVIGPKKLPDLAKSLGQALGEFKKATRELKDAIDIESEIDTAKDSFTDVEPQLTTNDENETITDIKDASIVSTGTPVSSEKKINNHDTPPKDSEGFLKNDRG